MVWSGYRIWDQTKSWSQSETAVCYQNGLVSKFGDRPKFSVSNWDWTQVRSQNLETKRDFGLQLRLDLEITWVRSLNVEIGPTCVRKIWDQTLIVGRKLETEDFDAVANWDPKCFRSLKIGPAFPCGRKIWDQTLIGGRKLETENSYPVANWDPNCFRSLKIGPSFNFFCRSLPVYLPLSHPPHCAILEHSRSLTISIAAKLRDFTWPSMSLL